MDNDGNIWVGTTDGLLLMNYKNRKVEITNMYDATKDGYHINSSDIVCLKKSPQGEMWVGTNGGGLCHCLGKDSESGKWMFETFGSKDGLPSEEIKSITFDKQGNVWFSTEHTICSFDTKRRVFSFFSIQDGVDNTICSECAAITLPDDRMIFGTVKGYYLIDKKKLASENGALLKLHITDFFLNEELQTPRMNSNYQFYVPESKKVQLPEHYSSFGVRLPHSTTSCNIASITSTSSTGTTRNGPTPARTAWPPTPTCQPAPTRCASAPSCSNRPTNMTNGP